MINRINSFATRLWFISCGSDEFIKMNERLEFRGRRSRNDRRQAQLPYEGEDRRKGDRRSGQNRRKSVRRADDPLPAQARD